MDTIQVPQKRTGADRPASLRDALLENITTVREILRKAQNGNGCEQRAE